MKIITNNKGDTYTIGILLKIFKRIIVISLEFSKKRGDWCDEKFVSFGKSTEKDIKGFHIGLMRIGLFVCWDTS